MFNIYRNSQHGKADHGWLKSSFHFSFAEYYNPERINFGSLRVLNDDIIEPYQGFPMHPHRDMEIISYIVNGSLAHEDSMGNSNILKRGEIQYMSAGTGIFHSEYNPGSQNMRLLQIWILPDKKNHKPVYGDFSYDWSSRLNKWLHIVSPENGEAPVQIRQNVNIYVTFLDNSKNIEFKPNNSKQIYLVQIEGSALINSNLLESGDSLEIDNSIITIEAKEDSHILVIELD